MNKKGNLMGTAIVFFASWIIGSLIASYWVDGIWCGIWGFIAAIFIAGGGTLIINLVNKGGH